MAIQWAKPVELRMDEKTFIKTNEFQTGLELQSWMGGPERKRNNNRSHRVLF
jgi:hypothetical protein